MDKEIITRNFSRYASMYDRYADVQKKTAEELLRKAGSVDFARILELGCGTGNYTFLLRDRFRQARINAVDISEKMIRVAQGKLDGGCIEFAVADAESLDLEGKFDLITSNACFQWFEDMKNALSRYKKMLNNDGKILFSIFGPQTFLELNYCIKSVLGGTSIAVDGFMAKEELKKIAFENFRDARVEEIEYKEDLKSLKQLLEGIKYTGTRGRGLSQKLYLSRGLLREIEEVYLKRFEKITSTYQVFFCQAKL